MKRFTANKATNARIAAAQKARWAKIKNPTGPVDLHPPGGFAPGEYEKLTPQQKREACGLKPRTAKDFAELAGCQYEAPAGDKLSPPLTPAVIDAKPLAMALDGPATWDTVKYWADLAAKFQHASVAAQVMAGFGLLELKKKFNVKPGRPKKELPHDAVITVPHHLPSNSVSSPDEKLEGINWAAMVETCAGVSDDTGRRWMMMAEGIKAKWKKMAPQARLKELMAVPPSQWSEKDVKLVTDSLHKVADGSTQIEFMRELGLAKEKSGGPGREPGCDGTKKTLTLSEEAALRQEEARSDWAGCDKLLRAYRDKFTVLTDTDVTAQIARLEQALNARNAWLKQPLNARQPALITEMLPL